MNTTIDMTRVRNTNILGVIRKALMMVIMVLGAMQVMADINFTEICRSSLAKFYVYEMYL
jgi:hypothetical protein